ncbi:PepSY-associated TM helix domain-containing protein [Pseudotamlana agarivorans]|uniref:PepSY-associated TM helix domain-containing protein n=1 Tax=Pseudotamlana agarivorans TaxID=481183 RepID=UPI0012F81CD1|nr:PepSY-associated TM helix domain-containing protein [Tamlana agarivorans]
MKQAIKNTLHKLHLWLGLVSGLVVFVVAITGCIYVFSYDIKEVIYKDRGHVEVPADTSKVSITALVNTASGVFDNKYPFQNIVITDEPDHAISISFLEIDNTAFGYHNYMKFYKTVYLNPYTGKIIYIENTKNEFFNVMLAVHMNLYMGYNDYSHYIIAGATWIFVFMLISGLILWWPKKSQRKQSFWFRWKKTSKWRRKNYDLHRIFGFYMLLIALLLALTGLMWASKSFNSSVKWVANGGKTIPYSKISDPKKTIYQDEPLDVIFQSTLTDFPDFKYILIRRHPKPSIPYIVRAYGHETQNYKRVEMYYDKNTAELLDTFYFKDKNNGEKIQALNYDLHVGSIGGLPTQILMFFASLLIASMPITGILIWYGRHYKKRRTRVK